MTFDEILKGVQTVGFPIVICAYFIWREARNKDTMSENLARLTALMTIMVRTMTLSESDKEKVQKLLEEGKKP
jgi:hypothetical protein